MGPRQFNQEGLRERFRAITLFQALPVSHPRRKSPDTFLAVWSHRGQEELREKVPGRNPVWRTGPDAARQEEAGGKDRRPLV